MSNDQDTTAAVRVSALSAELGPTLDAWAEANGLRFVSRSYGQYTTETVSKDALMELLRSVRAAERELSTDSWNGLLLELRQMADDSADRGDVFAQRVVALLSRS